MKRHAFIDIEKRTWCSRCGVEVFSVDEDCAAGPGQKFPIAFVIEGSDREWEGWITAPNVRQAVSFAIDALALRDGELIHMIHIGVPKPERP